MEEVEMPNINTQFKVPYYGQVSAGNFETVEIDTKELEVPDIAFNGRNPKECIALQVNGDSMNKVLSNGSYIIIHDYRRNQDYRLNNNDILVLRLGGEYTVKRVRRTETKLHLDPISYSDEFKTNTYDIDNTDEIEVIGKVIYNYQILSNKGVSGMSGVYEQEPKHWDELIKVPVYTMEQLEYMVQNDIPLTENKDVYKD